jgi:Uncharacterised MFS-type transporter YbfB
MPLQPFGVTSLVVSSVLIGAFIPGIATLALGRVQELIHDPHAQRKAWSVAMTSFAVFQAGGAYFLTYLFDRSGADYDLLFIVGAGAMMAALVSSPGQRQGPSSVPSGSLTLFSSAAKIWLRGEQGLKGERGSEFRFTVD